MKFKKGVVVGKLENVVKFGKESGKDIIMVCKGNYLSCKWSDFEYFQGRGWRYIGTVRGWYSRLKYIFESE